MRARSTIARASRPAGSVPNALPQSPSSRVAQNASATGAGAWRSSRLACSANAIISTMRRAIGSRPVGSARRRSRSSTNRRAAHPRRAPARPRRGSTATRLRLALHRAQHVEADDVAGAFPDAVERRLAIEPLHQVIGDEAVAAMAFERLGDELRRALAGPVFRDRRADARQQAFRAVGLRAVQRMRQRAWSSTSSPRSRPRGRRARCA